MNASKQNFPIQLVIFDLAGTTVDFGCMAPVAAFIQGFKDFGIDVSAEQVRGPMGMEKRAHIEALASLEGIADQWHRVHGRAIGELDIDAMYTAFVPNLLSSLPRYSRAVPGLDSCIRDLTEADIGYAATTGYFRDAANIVLDSVREYGFEPQASCCATEVPVGRPAPWMIYRCMELMGVYPPSTVVNVGDTAVDVESGRNAGVWSVGVTASGNAIGLPEEEFCALSEADKKVLLDRAEAELLAAGAHYVIESIAQLPQLIRDIESKGV